MPYPPIIPPNRSNLDPQLSTHPDDHNAIGAALQDLTDATKYRIWCWQGSVTFNASGVGSVQHDQGQSPAFGICIATVGATRITFTVGFLGGLTASFYAWRTDSLVQTGVVSNCFVMLVFRNDGTSGV